MPHIPQGKPAWHNQIHLQYSMIRAFHIHAYNIHTHLSVCFGIALLYVYKCRFTDVLECFRLGLFVYLVFPGEWCELLLLLATCKCLYTCAQWIEIHYHIRFLDYILMPLHLHMYVYLTLLLSPDPLPDPSPDPLPDSSLT